MQFNSLAVSIFLNNINKPSDIKGLSEPQLRQLAEEIRKELVSVVMKNGGHLASNLGVVELTLALHRVFDSPRDKIIWDVGHQCYVHKLLTGRREQFASLRQYGGLSGYTCREECEHDSFGAGHASTSISAGLGMAIARDLAGDNYHIISVIGDGAITGGMALEALNHAGHLGKRLIVVLNDNGMSISPTVGALSRFMSHIRVDRRFQWAYKEGRQVLKSLPMGDKLTTAERQVESGIKGLIMPTMIWEELGFTYLGVVDGHNLADLELSLSKARDYTSGPVLVHVRTVKGKGYQPAEGDAVYFHGISAPKFKGEKTLSYSEVFANTLLKMSRDDPKIVVITPAMPEGTAISIVEKEFPERVFDVGICEQHAVTLAAGMAAGGYKPVLAIYSTFLQRAFDQVIHDVCLQDLPVVFGIDRSGIVGDDGKTHQGAFDISYLSLIPNMVLAAPKDENELQHLVFTAVNCAHPMAIRYPRGSGLGVTLDENLTSIPVGEWEKLDEGTDIALLAVGAMVAPARQACELLQQQGILAAVINARFIKPLDEKMLGELFKNYRYLLTVEENVLSGGFGQAVLEAAQSRGICNARIENLGLPDEFVEHGEPEALRAACGLDAAGIAKRAVEILGKPEP